jgi:hypothetical protein
VFLRLNRCDDAIHHKAKRFRYDHQPLKPAAGNDKLFNVAAKKSVSNNSRLPSDNTATSSVAKNVIHKECSSPTTVSAVRSVYSSRSKPASKHQSVLCDFEILCETFIFVSFNFFCKVLESYQEFERLGLE